MDNYKRFKKIMGKVKKFEIQTDKGVVTKVGIIYADFAPKTISGVVIRMTEANGVRTDLDETILDSIISVKNVYYLGKGKKAALLGVAHSADIRLNAGLLLRKLSEEEHKIGLHMQNEDFSFEKQLKRCIKKKEFAQKMFKGADSDDIQYYIVLKLGY